MVERTVDYLDPDYLIRTYWLAISELFHIRPWEIERVSYDQLATMCRVIDERMKPRAS